MKFAKFNAEKVRLIRYLQDLDLSDEQINEIVDMAFKMSSASLMDYKSDQDKGFEIAIKYLG